MSGTGPRPEETVTFDPEALTAAQRYGDACVVCHKKWPRPRVFAGRLPDGAPVLACDECAPALRRTPEATAAAEPADDRRLRRFRTSHSGTTLGAWT